MTKIYTELQLLRYYYKETDLFETLETEYALYANKALRVKYKSMKKTIDSLNVIVAKPTNTAIGKILAYSRTHVG